MEYFADIRSLAITSSVISLVLCVCMVYVFMTRKTYAGFRYWTIASVLYSVGMVLMGLRGLIPDGFSIIIANGFLVAGSCLIAHGLNEFFEKSSCRRLLALLTATCVTLCVYYTYFSPDINARIIIVSSVIAFVYSYCSFLIFKFFPRLLNGRNSFLVAVFFLQGMWNVVRVYYALYIEGKIADYMYASSFHGLTTVIFFSGNILLILGLVAMNFQRMEYDLLTALEEVKTLQGIIPICSSCKKIRDDQGIWNQIEAYISTHSEAEFSHGICPECVKKLYPEIGVD